jgi:hypothetical protein
LKRLSPLGPLSRFSQLKELIDLSVFTPNKLNRLVGLKRKPKKIIKRRRCRVSLCSTILITSTDTVPENDGPDLGLSEPHMRPELDPKSL